MADTTTTNYGWVVPAIGTSAYAPKINTDLQDIDTDLFTVQGLAEDAQDAADAAQATADEALAGTAGISPTAITPSGSVSTWTASIDLSVGGPVYRIPMVGLGVGSQLTVTFTNRPATLGKMVYLHITASGNTLTTFIGSGSKQWAIPFTDDVSATGTQNLGTCASGSQVAYPLYIIAGV